MRPTTAVVAVTSRAKCRAASVICIAPLLAGCFTTPPTPAVPAQVEVPPLPRSEVSEVRAAGNERQITCEKIDAERQATDSLISKVQADRWSLICLKPTLKAIDQDKLGGAAIECIAYLPICAVIGIVAAVEYQVKKPDCPDEAGRAAKDAALGQRLEELNARKKTLEALKQEKRCER